MMEIKTYGKLPDPFKKEDGTRMTPEEWKEYRKELKEKIVDIQFGGMPPKPEYLRIEPLNNFFRGRTAAWYKIYVGTKEKHISFTLELHMPYVEVPGNSVFNFAEGEKYPVILTGDGCYLNMSNEVIKEINDRGYIAARFNRLELANDIRTAPKEGGIHDIYDGDYTDISAWAWGYMACMDVFEQIPFVDETEVAIVGHSRGAKTTMLAAAVDERIKYVCVNSACCNGAVSQRCEVTGLGDEGNLRTETLKDQLRTFPKWSGKKLSEYADRIDELPYDMHYFGAMVAPRFYMQCEGMQDYWGNPMGAWMNFAAVKECYKYLGCEDNAGAWFKIGDHEHGYKEYMEFLDFVDRSRNGLPLREHLKINPYPEMDKNFDW
jgi:hypothetical protein